PDHLPVQWHRHILSEGGEKWRDGGYVGMHAADPPRILLVEDDPALRGFLTEHLAADGFAPLAAETFADGLRMLEYKHPDLALVDLGLPDRSGLELIARVRAADGIVSRLDPATPIVVLTGRAGEIDVLRGFER